MTPEQALHEAIEGRRPLDGLTAESRQLVRLAVDCQRIEVAGPSAAAMMRMSVRFERFLDEDARPGLAAWLGAWLGAGGVPRPVAQRLAAAGLLVGAAGFGGAAATGNSPAEVVSGIASFAANAVANLAPNGEEAAPPGGGPVESAPDDPPAPAVPLATSSPEPTSTPSPAADAATPPPTNALPGTAAADNPAGGAASPGLFPATPTPAGTALPATPFPTPSPTGTTTPADGTGGDGSPAAVPTDSPALPPTASATPSPPGSATPTPSTTPAASPTPDGEFETSTVPAGEAGNVVLRYSASTIEIVEVQPATGWKYEIKDAENLSVEVEFEGSGRHIRFRATLEDGTPVTTVTESEGDHED